MRQAVLRVEWLPESALDASSLFHREWLPQAREALDAREALVMVFAEAPYDHRGWRLAAVQDLARQAAPGRVNAVVGSDGQATAETIEWLARSPGITGQLLAVSSD
jgi:hypothetical protein